MEGHLFPLPHPIQSKPQWPHCGQATFGMFWRFVILVLAECQLAGYLLHDFSNLFDRAGRPLQSLNAEYTEHRVQQFFQHILILSTQQTQPGECGSQRMAATCS